MSPVDHAAPIPTAPPLNHQPLRKRHWFQIVNRPPHEYEGLLHLAGTAFLPRHGGTLNTPIPRVGSALLVILSYHRVAAPIIGGEDRYVPFLRSFQSRVDRHDGTVIWDTSNSSRAFDLSLPIRSGPSMFGLSAPDLAIAQLALEIDRACLSSMKANLELRSSPTLPPLLLGYASRATFHPQPTPFVLAHAAKTKQTWSDAWHALHQEMQVSDVVNRTGLKLIDSRLYPHLKPSRDCMGSLTEFFDLRQFVRTASVTPATGCDPRNAGTDGGSMHAGQGPRRPATTAGTFAPTVEVWMPSGYGMKPTGFIFRQPGVRANLWHVHPKWMRIVKPHPSYKRDQASGTAHGAEAIKA